MGHPEASMALDESTKVGTHRSIYSLGDVCGTAGLWLKEKSVLQLVDLVASGIVYEVMLEHLKAHYHG